MIMIYDIDSLLSELGNPLRAFSPLFDDDGGCDDWGDDSFFASDLSDK